MTLPATDTWDVRGLEGQPYTVGPKCSNPTCTRYAQHAHHIVRRSALGGAFAWVELHGIVRGNLTGLCVPCHDDVTGEIDGHKAAIRFHLEDELFWWTEVHDYNGTLEYSKVGPLDPQPPTPKTLTERAHGQGTESEHCPFCGQTRRRREPQPASLPRGERRRRKSWSISVPDDAENGAEILQGFTDDVAELLGAGDWKEHNKRYWVLVHVFAWVLQQREQFAQDVKEAA
jgi:hypothetical protein